jgi:hypothetical protein
MVVPAKYSKVNPLLLPLLADLHICGSQKEEYIVPTKNSVMDGERMTRTIKVKKINKANPVAKNVS